MLRWFHRNLARKQEGFTLIELMVVVAILAVLAFLALPKVLEALDKSKLNSGISIANEIANAMERYAAQNGEATVVAYPTEAAVNDAWADLATALGGHAKLPTALTALKYFRGSATAPTIDYETANNDTEYVITLTSADKAADVVCIKPGGVEVKAAGSTC